MTKDINDDTARERLEDFFQDFEEAQQRCEHLLIELEQAPGNPTLPDAVFRTLQTMKDCLLYAGLREITPLVQVLENIIDALRAGTIAFDALLSDVVLVAIDRLHSTIEERVRGQTSTSPLSLALDQICQSVIRIIAVQAEERTSAVHDALTLMDPALALDVPAPAKKPLAPTVWITFPNEDIESILAFFGVSVDPDIQFFLSMNVPLEARSLFWKGRTARQLNLALAMNHDAGMPVSKEQLAAAVILHDIGMAFLPIELLHAKHQLSTEALELLQGHTEHGYALMKPLKRWKEAAQAILQHHERIDGTGYPFRIPGNEICDAAKILAIVDTFEARTHERAHTHMTKRPFIRAILEINSCAGTQFDMRWVEHFNRVAHALTTQDKR